MIRNIIFDFGGVILTLSHDEAVRRYASLGLKDAEKILNPYTQSGIFGDLELGAITGEDFRRELSKLIGKEVSYEDCANGMLGYRKELPQRNLDKITQLRNDGYRVILLSNTNPFMMSWADSGEFDGKGHPIDYYFDAVYLSYRVKMMKPDERFFRYVLEQEQIRPEETLFLDDGPRNVAAAGRVGIHTFCPKNGEDWTRVIDDYLRL